MKYRAEKYFPCHFNYKIYKFLFLKVFYYAACMKYVVFLAHFNKIQQFKV